LGGAAKEFLKSFPLHTAPPLLSIASGKFPVFPTVTSVEILLKIKGEDSILISRNGGIATPGDPQGTEGTDREKEDFACPN